MIEKDMEDLIAAFPDDYFLRKHFVLVGRCEYWTSALLALGGSTEVGIAMLLCFRKLNMPSCRKTNCFPCE
jgi:hypothetical protein